MIEIYVLLTLGMLGYYLNKNSNDTKKNRNIIDVNENPSMRNVYESNYINTANQKLIAKASKKYNQSTNPTKTNIISKNYDIDSKNLNKNEELIKSLTGEYINKEHFMHNNMTPYYGGSIKQNIDEHSNKTILESFTGVNDFQKKCETKSFNDLNKNTVNVNGNQNYDEFYRDRFVKPMIRNNEFPIEQIKVGPGLGQGYTSKPTGGYQQFDVQDYAKDRCVDELRAKLNPNKNALGMTDNGKQTFEARVIEGNKEIKRAELPTIDKNRPERFYEQTPDMLFKTTAANLKPGKQGAFNVKDTNRLTTNKEQIGGAFANDQLKRTVDSSVRSSNKQEYEVMEFGNANLTNISNKKDDYGKSKILVYNNERDVTSTRVYQGNITSMIKSIIAPIEDMIKITKKQHDVDNPRHFGNISIQFPDKQTVYDPNQVAKTTIKETLIHDEIGRGNLTGAKELYVYDPDEIAKTTIRNTTDRMAYEMNLSGGQHKGVVYDPDDTTRVTMKQTLVDLEREYGNINSLTDNTGYQTGEFDPRLTQKAFISDNDYIGVVNKYKGEGYLTNEHEAKDTQKQFLSQLEHFGIAEATENKKQISYEDMYNAEINDRKEQILFDREPTQTGKKVFNNKVNNFRNPVLKYDDINLNLNTKDRIFNVNNNIDSDTITKEKNNYDFEKDNRLDISILDQLKNNPFVLKNKI